MQTHSQADSHAETATAQEGPQAEGPVRPKKKGLFKRGWGSHKGNAEKQVKPSKSKLGEGPAVLAHKSAGTLPCFEFHTQRVIRIHANSRASQHVVVMVDVLRYAIRRTKWWDYGIINSGSIPS